jgi:nicotinamide-nucleotide amidase
MMSDYEINQILEQAEQVVKRLKEKKMTLAVSESVTAGGFSYYLTSVPGSSEVLTGGIIAYTAPVKIALSGVSKETIDKKGVVSSEVAIEMASGVRERFGTDIGMGVTGFAGPSGGDQFASIGQVYWGFAKADIRRFLELKLTGDRYSIRLTAIKEGMDFLFEAMR